ncbi:MAG: hypothetical protein IT434_05905 [Phycisphaerales bacterium]|jgi:hypothetical protein|nr:hypothetical protein [Phycisphaerales bacterium]
MAELQNEPGDTSPPETALAPAPSHDRVKVRTFVFFWLAQTFAMWVLGRLLFGSELPEAFSEWWNDVADADYLLVIGVHSLAIAGVQGVIMLPARPPGVRGPRDVPWLHHALAALIIGAMTGGTHAALIAILEALNVGWGEAAPKLYDLFTSLSMVLVSGVTGVGVAFGLLITVYRERTPLGLVACVCALCAAALLGGLGFIAMSLWSVTHDHDAPDEAFAVVLTATLVMWTFATPLLGAFLRRQSDETRLHLVAKRLFIGSVVETVSMVPLDVMVRRKSNCYCGEGTFFALLICSTIGLIALGPMVFLLPLGRRRRRLEAGRCPLCGYDMSAIPKAERCPECGAGWRPSSSVMVDPGV